MNSFWLAAFLVAAAPAAASTCRGTGARAVLRLRIRMERLIALGVDGIITDYPDRLKALMDERGIRPKAYGAS